MHADSKIGVVCVDDNQNVAEAIELLIGTTGDFQWDGWLENADALLSRVEGDCPSVILLDLDMPGSDPIEAIQQTMRRCPLTRFIIFTGHVRRELIDRAIDAGAWGYVSKNDGEHALLDAMRRVTAGEFSLSREAREAYQ